MVKKLLAQRRTPLLPSKTARLWAAVGFAVLLLHWAFVLAFVAPRLGQLDFLKLHYTAQYGVDWIAAWQHIFVFPLFGLGAFFLNAWLAIRLYPRYRVFAEFVLQVTVLLEVTLAAAGVIAALLNA
jgi:hypothetical protein